ncbi:MAG TPA: serine hydrolase domain-containing protein [Aliidongia sp.]|nr:serine hydrolase domain-containing protein [Aliidongia sp.]
MGTWLDAALGYIPRWLDYQMRQTEQPGCVIAVAKDGELLLEQAWGAADLKSGEALTPRHRFRVASHSKSFTAAAILKLREQGKLRLDDPVGRHVAGLHPDVAAVTLAQLLSHTAGLVRDGADTGQWSDRRPFLNEAEIRADLAAGPTIEPNTRLKYSNHGFGVLGLVVEAATDEPYNVWMAREIVAAAGLAETSPDMPIPPGTPFARGHGSKLPLGRRVVIPGENPTNALAAATGFVSTAADLARFFNQLAPEAETSLLTVASRREMTRRHWAEAHSSGQRHYGLGTGSGKLGDWDWFGHSGGFQGYITRTTTIPAERLTLSILTNAADGPAQGWSDGALHIFQRFAKEGAPAAELADWRGRWWGSWGAFDLLAMKDKVLVASPGLTNPLLDASEITVIGPDEGRIALAGSFANHGEPASLERGPDGTVAAVKLGGSRLQPEAELAAELKAKYED